MEQLALIYFANQADRANQADDRANPLGSPAPRPRGSPSSPISGFATTVSVGNVPVGPGRTFTGSPGPLKIRGMPAGTYAGGPTLGYVRAYQSPRMGNLEIAPVEGVPRVYFYNHLDLPLVVSPRGSPGSAVGESFTVPARGVYFYDGPRNAPYVPLGITFETAYFPPYRLLRPYDVIEFGI